MRAPAPSNGDKIPEIGAPAVHVVVSIPDRRRIDSDVRAFLREPSTPWIVFDQEGRPPSQLAVGEMLPARSAILSEHGFFPATAAIDASASIAYKQVEPSSLAVAADLTDAVPHVTPQRGPSRRVLGASAGVVALLATLAIGAVALRGTTHSIASAPAVAGVQAAKAPTATEALPPAIDVSAAAAKLTGASPDESPAKIQARKYGRLSVAGDARFVDVYMDGKRMLGRGTRTFTVMCGPHTIAVGTKTTNVREVDIACTGTAELVIGN